MSHELPIPVPLRALFDAVCDEMATDEQLRELESALQNEATRELYWEYCSLHVDLHFAVHQQERQDLVRENIRAEAFCVPDLPPASGLSLFGNAMHGATSYFSSSWPVAYLVATVIVGVGLLIGTLVHVSQPKQIATQATPIPASPSTIHYPLPTTHSIVGQVTGMVDCQWADPSTATLDRASVPLGRKYALSSGLMEITYDTGAKVILQGPVTYEVESPAGGYLSVGKLTARVENKEERRTKNEELPASRSSFLTPHSYFAVRTPTAAVTDLGTEFGVEVSKTGTTTSYVFRGSVEVQPVDRDGRRGEAVRLIENESVQVESSVSTEALAVARVTVDPAAFVRVEQLPKLAAESRLKAFRRWQAYSQELRRDPSLLAYYDFQQKPGLPSVLSNVSANGDESLDGVIENATWSDGRMTGKHALLFNGPSDYVQVNLPQKVDDLTLAAWINADSLTNIYNGILMSDDCARNGMMHCVVWSEGQISFTVIDTPPINPKLGSAGPDRVPVRRWVHLAIVYDHAAARVWFYADGQRKDDAAVEKHVPVCIGPARIGRWAGAPPYNLYGRMDELAVFGRALKPDEIQRMYEAGKPTGN